MVASKKILVLDAGDNSHHVDKVPRGSLGPIDVSTHYHLNVLKSYAKDVYDPDNALVFGCGPFAGSKIGGVYRATFFARSPIWKGLFSSNMGGAGIALYGSGFDFFMLRGRAKKPTIISVSSVDGVSKVEFLSITVKKLSSIFSGYKGVKGTYALERFAFDSFKNNFKIASGFVPVRSFAVGPGALVTDYSGILSTFINAHGEFEVGREDWAGRGGFGSLMVQAYNVVAIVIGGNCDSRAFSSDLKDISVVNTIFKKELGEGVGKAMMDATSKYRYIEKVKSGGTFGVNFSSLDGSMLSYNWSSVGFSETKRKKIYKDLVSSGYLAQFNERVIKTRSWKTCGEICPAMCKKIDGIHKIDYEPYEANGPNCGIFDLKAVEGLVRLCDENGFDAIHMGSIISFVIEAKSIGLLTDAEVKGKVSSLSDVMFDSTDDSNAKIGASVINLIIAGDGIGKVLRRGLRAGSKELDVMFSSRVKKVSFNDIAVYVSNGPDGEIVPNQYWVPGFFIPLPIQGKFLTYYGSDFLMPYDLGVKSAERFMEEFQTDNLGICRFHRGWSEKMKDALLKAALGDSVNFDATSVIQSIIKYDILAGALPSVPESLRVKEMLYHYIKNMGVKFPENKDISGLLSVFEKDIDAGVSLYFYSSKDGINKVFGTDF
ncbi:MAG: hypothetical protein GQ477_05915 [Nanohaloarchaea archaeon]|nr:hypothetical protein [Candidatus Nanohaloarchaea archaeon]